MNSRTKTIGNYEYDPSVCVGEGAFGKVYKGLNTQTREIVAIKQMDAGPIRRDQYLSKALKYETDILGKLNHPNIVRLMDFFESQNYYYLITEFCDSGDLKQYMKNYRQGAPEKEAQIIFTDIVEGLNAIYQQKATHRDLKPANILKNSNRYKIADFGFAKVLDKTNEYQQHQTCVGSPLYMAPQILSRKSYGPKCDLWSLGVMYYEILTGRPPFTGVNESDLLSNIKRYQFRPLPNVSALSNEFLSKALILDEERRIDFEETFNIFNQFKKLNKGTSIVEVPRLEQSIVINPINPKIFQDPQNDKQKYIKTQLDITKQLLAFISFVVYETFSQYRICNEFQDEELEIETLIYMMAKYVEKQSKKALEKAKVIEVQDYQQMKQQYDYFGEFLKDFENHMNILGLIKGLQEKDEIKQFQSDFDKFSLTINEYIKLRLFFNFKKKYFGTITKDSNTLKDNDRDLLFKYMRILYYLLKMVELKGQLEKVNLQTIDISQYHQFKEKDLKKAFIILIELEKY